MARRSLTTLFMTAALAALTATAPAFAQSKTLSDESRVVLASDPQSLVNFLESQGFPSRLTEDAVGDPLIEFRSHGDKQSLFFYDCTDNTDCQAVQFYAGYRTEGDVTLETLNSWNSERRFVRAYLTDEDVARIEMDVATSDDGISYRDFDALLDLWLDSVVLFEDHIGW